MTNTADPEETLEKAEEEDASLKESEFPPNLDIEIVESSNELLRLGLWLQKNGFTTEANDVFGLR